MDDRLNADDDHGFADLGNARKRHELPLDGPGQVHDAGDVVRRAFDLLTNYPAIFI